jgi:hypothetical protein
MATFQRPKGDSRLTVLDLLKSMPDPLLSFKWVCTELPLDHPVHYVESINLPFLNVGIGDKAHASAGYSYFPSTHDISSFSITFYEDSNAKSSKFLWKWKNEIKDFSTGLYNLPGSDGSGYKKTIKVALLDTANNKVLSANLLGVWPADTDSLNLNYTEVGGRITISQTFSIDDQELQFHF